MNLKEKLLNIQTTLKAEKGQYNSFGKYAYRSCEDILESLKPHLAREKAIVKLEDKIIMVGDRYYVEATARLIDVESDEEIINTASAREEENKKGMDSSQVTGATSSYARKYALNGLFGIDDNKDSDATNKHGKDEEKPENKKITPKNDVESQIKDICRDLSANYENGKDECLKILKKYEPEKGLTKNMPKSVLPTVLKDIQQLKVDMEKA